MLFLSDTGMPAKPLYTVLGSRLIQKQYGYFDRELLEQIKGTPYYQYIIGLPIYQNYQSFVPSLLVESRKYFDAEVLMEINLVIIAYNTPDN